MILAGIGGIGIGAIVWWFLITYFISKLRRWFNVRGIWLMNKIVGSVIMIVSIIGFLMVFLN